MARNRTDRRLAKVLVIAGALSVGCGGDNSPRAADVAKSSVKNSGPAIGKSAPTSVPPSPTETPTGVVCTKFDAAATFSGGHLHIDIETDLPPDIELNLIVSREYFEKGNSSAYAVDYIDEKAPIADWSVGRDFVISNVAAMKTYAEKQEQLAATGLAAELDHFGKSIEVWLLVRLKDPKVSGTCEVTDRGHIEKKWDFKYPLDAKPKPILSLNPEGLVEGDRFQITKDTPLMPSPDPDDPAAALAQMVKLAAKSLVTVKSVREIRGNRWYEVMVDGKHGWINSTALIGQALKREK